MALRKIRTGTGRLRAGERKRRLNAARLQPGEVIILDRTRRRSTRRKGGTGGKRLRNAFSVELRVGAQFALDLDVRKLLSIIRLRLAQHYASKLLAGQRASGRGRLPALDVQFPEDQGRTRGVKSGDMARQWMMLPIRGGAISARTMLKPWGGDGRRYMINRELERGVDYQSIDGEAAEVIAKATDEWLGMISVADGVATPKRADLKGTTLDRA